jgi:hypothetical protein
MTNPTVGVTNSFVLLGLERSDGQPHHDACHGGSHCGAPPELVAAQWQLLKDHPFGVTPEPYMGKLPSSFPSYCKIITK